jgi:hypothetical protein
MSGRFGDFRRSFKVVSYCVKNSKVFQLRIFLVTFILNLSVKGGKTYLMLQCRLLKLKRFSFFFKESWNLTFLRDMGPRKFADV